MIHRFASRVTDRERLDLLYLLTCADIAGTSPKLWNGWKDRLLADLYTATRLALRRGLEYPLAAAERVDETRDAARSMLGAFGLGSAAIDELFARMPRTSFLRGRADQVAWQASALRDAAPGDTVVQVRPLMQHSGALEVFVHSPDRDGLFASIVATLDRMGLAIQHARVLHGPAGEDGRGTIFDTFEVLPPEGREPPEPARIEQRLREALAGSLEDVRPARRTQPRHLRHFRIVPQVGFSQVGDGKRTLLSVVCTDRPGLLADIAQALRTQRLRVHDARIATFGERAEDVFQITDEHDRVLDEPRQQALREAMLAGIDGEGTQ